jgi:hypothetical protein
MKKRFFLRCSLLALFPFAITKLINAQEWKALSPGKNLQISLALSEGKLSYNVINEGNTLIKSSVLGIERDDEDFSHNLLFVKTTSLDIDEYYTLKIGKLKINHAVANETSVTFKNNNSVIVNIDLRAYDDGVAFRYRFTGENKKVTVRNEATEFVIPEGKTWIQNYDLPHNGILLRWVCYKVDSSLDYRLLKVEKITPRARGYWLS